MTSLTTHRVVIRTRDLRRSYGVTRGAVRPDLRRPGPGVGHRPHPHGAAAPRRGRQDPRGRQVLRRHARARPARGRQRPRGPAGLRPSRLARPPRRSTAGRRPTPAVEQPAHRRSSSVEPQRGAPVETPRPLRPGPPPGRRRRSQAPSPHPRGAPARRRRRRRRGAPRAGSSPGPPRSRSPSPCSSSSSPASPSAATNAAASPRWSSSPPPPRPRWSSSLEPLGERTPVETTPEHSLVETTARNDQGLAVVSGLDDTSSVPGRTPRRPGAHHRRRCPVGPAAGDAADVRHEAPRHPLGAHHRPGGVGRLELRPRRRRQRPRGRGRDGRARRRRGPEGRRLLIRKAADRVVSSVLGPDGRTTWGCGAVGSASRSQ